jgi:hypothetical protein
MAYSILSRNNALLIDVAEISNYVLWGRTSAPDTSLVNKLHLYVVISDMGALSASHDFPEITG